MNLKTIVTVFAVVFLSELGDKTQLATLLFASEKQHSLLSVFIGAALALVAATLLAVLVGDALRHYLNRKPLTIIAGAGFLILGLISIYQGVWG